MKHLYLPTLAALTIAMTISPASAPAQNPIAQLAIGSPAQLERASLDLPASSSSSASGLFETPAQSSITIQPAPAATQPKTSTKTATRTDAKTGAGPFSGLAVGIKFGFAGAGLDVATPLVRRNLNLRGSASFFSYNNASLTEDNVNITGDVKLQNASAMVDWFPFRGGFRISGGATVYNNTGLNAALSVPPGQSFTLGGNTFYSQPGNPATGTAIFAFGGNKIAPRVTIGSGNMLPAKGRVRLITEVGFQYIAQPSVVYNISGNACLSDIGGVYTNCGPVPQSAIAAEENKLQNDLTDLRFYPILSVGLSFRIH